MRQIIRTDLQRTRGCVGTQYKAVSSELFYYIIKIALCYDLSVGSLSVSLSVRGFPTHPHVQGRISNELQESLVPLMLWFISRT